MGKNENVILLEAIRKDRIKAMKEKDPAKLSTLRMLINELDDRLKIKGDAFLTNEEVGEVIAKQIKKLDKEAEAYKAVGHSTEKQDAEKAVLQSYLPEPMPDDEIRVVIERAIRLTNIGEAKNPMQYLSVALKGKADMKRVSELLKQYK